MVPSAAPAAPPADGAPVTCLASGDGYFRARVGGNIDAAVDWPNSGTLCQGEVKGNVSGGMPPSGVPPSALPPGIRLSFQRPGAVPDLLFVFGLAGVRPGQDAHAVGTNLTLFVQGTAQVYGTLGYTRCTLDTLSQRPLAAAGTYRVEARGFCTQPAHAVRGAGAVYVSTFEFAGVLTTDPVATPAMRQPSTTAARP